MNAFLRFPDTPRSPSCLKRLGVLLLCLLLGAGGAHAATYTITGTAGGGGSCSGGPDEFTCTTLRAAIAAANATPDDDDIVFDGDVFTDATSSRIQLVGSSLLVDVAASTGGRLVIDGTRGDGGKVILDGNNYTRVMTIYGGAVVTLRHLNLIRGRVQSLGGNTEGGALYNGGTLLLQHSTISGSGTSGSSSRGGGIFNYGSMSIEHTTVSGNVAEGGGGGGGAGIYNGGTMSLISSTITGNTAAAGTAGGILNNNGATLTIAHSTVSGNVASQGGGGIRNHGTLALNHVTILANSNSGLYQVNGVATLVASVIGGGDCRLEVSYGGTVNASHSLIQNGLGCVNGTNTGNLTGDPLLGSLADHGGDTLSHLPHADSPLLDRATCTANDQRGVTRPQGVACDIGAVERRQHLLTVNVTGHGQVDADSAPAPLGGAIAACTGDGGSCRAGHDAEHGDAGEISLTATPEAGWHFVGWNQDCLADAGDAARATVVLDADKHCEATFAVSQYSVSFDPQGGEAVAAINADYQSIVTLPETTRASHAFMTWNTASDGSGIAYGSGADFTIPAQHTTLYAQWSADTLYLVIDPADNLSGTCTAVAPHLAECDTLRAAIVAANGTLAHDTIAFSLDVFSSVADSTIVLTQGQLVIANALSSGRLDINGVRGDGGNVRLSGNETSRVLRVESGADAGLQRLDIVAGSAESGGGIQNHGTLSFTHGSVSDSVASETGGGIENHGVLWISHATLSGNQASHGGGVRNLGVLIVENSTLSGNTAILYGGGVETAGELALEHVTVVGNQAQWGGGVSFLPGGALLRSSLLAGNTAAYGTNCYYDVSVTANDAGRNLDDGTGCGFSHATSLSDADADLGPLQDNGGPTRTHLPGPASAAIDAAGDCGDIHPDDQRGIARPQQKACDIGAVEVPADAIFADGFEP